MTFIYIYDERILFFFKSFKVRALHYNDLTKAIEVHLHFCVYCTMLKPWGLYINDVNPFPMRYSIRIAR